MLSLIYAPCLLWCCISSTLQFFSLLYEWCLINYINVKIFQTMIVARFQQLNEHVLLQLWRKRSNPAQGTYTQETWLTAGILLHFAVIFIQIHISTFCYHIFNWHFHFTTHDTFDDSWDNFPSVWNLVDIPTVEEGDIEGTLKVRNLTERCGYSSCCFSTRKETYKK